MIDGINEERIGDLLIEWDEKRQQGEELSAAELCRDCPELIPEIESRIESLKVTDWLYDEPEIDGDDALSLPPLDTALFSQDETDLPATPLSADDLIERLNDSGLIPAKALQSVRENLPTDSADARSLAQELIRLKKLTHWQASVLLEEGSEPLVLGDYVILHRIGEGGMGQVYQARHRRMKRLVALKVLPAGMVNSPGMLERFEREVEAAARLSHPNIVIAHDAGESEGTHYLTMEYVKGETLRGLAQNQGLLPVEAAVECVRQAAHGLAYAHENGVIHRDIKHSNLMLDHEGTVKILDMGLARFEEGLEPEEQTGELTTAGTVMGTADFMAPEQAVDQVRRPEHRQLQAEGDERLTGTRQMWLFYPENLSESKTEKLNVLRKQSLAMSRARG